MPIFITTKGKQIPEWQLDEYGLAGELKDSPVLSDEKVEEIELIPMGAARLRIKRLISLLTSLSEKIRSFFNFIIHPKRVGLKLKSTPNRICKLKQEFAPAYVPDTIKRTIKVFNDHVKQVNRNRKGYEHVTVRKNALNA